MPLNTFEITDEQALEWKIKSKKKKKKKKRF